MKKRMTALLLALAMLLPLMGAALAEQEIWQRGDRGEKVAEIQNRLKALGYLKQAEEGFFDEATEKALTAFQQRSGLLATGMADRKTMELLFSEEAQEAVEETGGFWFETEEAMEDSGAWVSYAAPMATSIPLAMGGVTAKGFRGSPEAWNTNEYTRIRESGFQSAAASPLSTFAADVDTASYAQLRRMILNGEIPPAGAVRIEEMLNYFRYDYAYPAAGEPFGVTMELARCPWNPETLLLQVGLQAEEIAEENRAPHNLVFLMDVSGSMFGSDRLDLVKRAFQLLLEELEPTDTVSLVTYASRDEVVLEGVPAADKTRIMAAISSLEAGGSTNSAAGIQTAYALAEKYAVQGSVNRILMATDGDFNVGMTSEGELARLVSEKKKAGIRLTMLGVGYGNYKDNKLEALADYGDGNYYYLDTVFEARRALVTEAGGTLREVAKDVKLQLDFNPARVQAYRLIGYEDRVMDAQDFADDTKDGGEIGSGHRMTALYEIVPVGSGFETGIPESRYAKQESGAAAEETGDWCTLSIRWKAPGEEASRLKEVPFAGDAAETLSPNMAWAAAVAECGMLLRDSEYKGGAGWNEALALARSDTAAVGDPYKEEFIYLLTLLQRADAE